MLHLTFRQLSVFEAVARHLNYSRAAEEMHLSQPAVSMQIKQLEENVGLSLFEQLGKKIFLTEAGHELYHYSRTIAQQLTEAEAVINELKGVKRGKLKISVASTANYFAPQLLATFIQRFPDVTVSLNVTNRETLLNQLAHNEMDMAIMGQPPDGLDLVAESFMDNPLVIIAPVNHPLVVEKSIPLERLQNETFLVREQGSGTRISMERFFSLHGIRLTTGMEMSSNEAIKQAVQAGLGLGIVSIHTLALELELNRLAVLDVESFPIMRHWFVVHRANKRLSVVSLAFKKFLLDEAAELMAQAS
ncbi:LysR family transcriptional regulator [Sulfurirhabdus autotrophica]|uniref:DNA-binding transcriptional LysR family regulator n=1 Tax=Sulfurirhabdus autotrophica TaxID=1706046 RepID=A0A4R3XYA9_9PROT|nr:LysR family transcriptional regulator [Sulfurirhabdus autotrophica]TCV84316.1 DNA-binding transcriptional LysR family regulator [Sulfurirhabdus autotrophica]